MFSAPARIITVTLPDGIYVAAMPDLQDPANAAGILDSNKIYLIVTNGTVHETPRGMYLSFLVRPESATGLERVAFTLWRYIVQR